MRALAIMMVICAASPARADEDESEARYQQGLKLFELDRHNEALVEFEAAYALRQRPIFLYEMGRAHQKLGHAKEARALFERYLVADPTIDPARRSEVDERLRAMVRFLPQPAPRATIPEGYVRARVELRPRRDLVIGGSVLLALGYLPALVTGGLFIAFGDGDVGGSLLIPIIGPVVSGSLLTHPAWSVPWIAVDHVAQAAGLAMIIAGKLTKKKVITLEGPIAVMPQSLPGGGAGLVAFGSF